MKDASLKQCILFIPLVNIDGSNLKSKQNGSGDLKPYDDTSSSVGSALW
jgi:hypothetical protein